MIELMDLFLCDNTLFNDLRPLECRLLSRTYLVGTVTCRCSGSLTSQWLPHNWCCPGAALSTTTPALTSSAVTCLTLLLSDHLYGKNQTKLLSLAGVVPPSLLLVPWSTATSALVHSPPLLVLHCSTPALTCPAVTCLTLICR